MADQDVEVTVEPPSTHIELASQKITSSHDGHQAKHQASDGEGDTREANGQPSVALVDGEDEASRLRALATDVRDQDELERDVGRQV